MDASSGGLGLARVVIALASRVFRFATPASRIVLTVDHPNSPVSSYFVPGVKNMSEMRQKYPCLMNDPDKEWIKKNNAIPLGMTVFKLIVQVKPNTSAVLRKVTVETISIEQVDGIALIRPIGGPVVALNLAVDLDKGSVTCRDSRDFPNSRDVDIDFNITQESPLVLRECGSATTRAVSWKLKLHFLVDGRRVFKHVPADTAITVPNDYRGIRRTYVGSDEWVEVRE